MIEATALTKRFGDRLAVDALTFTVRPGVVTGFLGPNGSGKSTTLRMVVGLDHPTSGTVTIGGRRYRDLEAPLHQVGTLLDARAVDGVRRARDHLTWLAAAGGIGRRRVGEVLELVGLAEVADQRIGGFSLGVCQRLGIAAALLGDPPVLLLDEPVNGLDPEGIRWVRRLVRFLAAEGRTVLVSSHLMSEMEATADHVLVIGRGRLLAEAPMAELTGRRARLRVVSPEAARLRDVLAGAGAAVATAADGSLEVRGLAGGEVAGLAARAGLPVHELTPLRARLEEAFFELTGDSVEFGTEVGGSGR